MESIIGQTYHNLQIILVDDGSTDGSGKLCDIYAEKDARVKVIHKTNGGLVSARKAGLRIAQKLIPSILSAGSAAQMPTQNITVYQFKHLISP